MKCLVLQAGAVWQVELCGEQDESLLYRPSAILVFGTFLM